MAKKAVVWTETAAKQRKIILKYWAEHNGSNVYSLKLIKLIDEKIALLQKFPMLYRETSYSGIRVLAMGNFSLFYKVNYSRIEIVAFWDNRQDPQKLFILLDSIE